MEKIIVLASSNKHKIKEINKILKDYIIKPMNEFGFNDEIIEDGKTFKENSLIKAKAIFEYLKSKGYNYPVLADDTGLCVKSLNNEPGVRSARYSSDHNDKINRELILEKLKGVENRTAYFMCVVTLIINDDLILTASGKTNGVITHKEFGSTEFGYDSIFYSNNLHKTFGECSEQEKNSVSHRGRALKNLLKKLNSLQLG